MIRRPLRSSFSPADQAFLLDSMRITRETINRLCASLPPTGPRYRRCQALTKEIDTLAADLTGDATLFHGKPHG